MYADVGALWLAISGIVIVLNLGTDPHLAASYRPISLLNVWYKLLERIILQSISATMEDFLSVAYSCMASAVAAAPVIKSQHSQRSLRMGPRRRWRPVQSSWTCFIRHHLAYWILASFINCPSACLSGAFRQWSCCYESAISGSLWETMSAPDQGRWKLCPRALSYLQHCSTHNLLVICLQPQVYLYCVSKKTPYHPTAHDKFNNVPIPVLLVQILLSEYVIERWFNIPPHLFNVLTLPWETLRR